MQKLLTIIFAQVEEDMAAKDEKITRLEAEVALLKSQLAVTHVTHDDDAKTWWQLALDDETQTPEHAKEIALALLKDLSATFPITTENTLIIMRSDMIQIVFRGLQIRCQITPDGINSMHKCDGNISFYDIMITQSIQGSPGEVASKAASLIVQNS
jgi:hypothetical protein